MREEIFDLTGNTNPKTSGTGEGINLLQFRPVSWLLHWPGFPYIFQVAMLIIFIYLAWLAWGVHAPPGVDAKLFAKTHLATLMIWGIWWPAMIWVAVLLGRAWCMVCPLELVSNVSERAAKALGFRQRPLKKWVISGVFIVFLYGLIQILVAGAHINRVPAYTSWFLIGLLAAAFITGLVFKDRASVEAFVQWDFSWEHMAVEACWRCGRDRGPPAKDAPERTVSWHATGHGWMHGAAPVCSIHPNLTATGIAWCAASVSSLASQTTCACSYGTRSRRRMYGNLSLHGR